MKRVTILLALTVLVLTSACKKAKESPSPESLLFGNWSGFMGDANSQTQLVSLIIASDLSYKMSGTHTATGNFKLENAILHGPAKYTGSLTADAFLVLKVSSDSKILTGYISGTDNGSSLGLHYIFNKQ